MRELPADPDGRPTAPVDRGLPHAGKLVELLCIPRAISRAQDR
ncbi:MAG: hypothetical protein QGI46_10445 [Planctomycetota bacterium]|nr:hypothetical protein [Planctomycetota bacterium]